MLLGNKINHDKNYVLSILKEFYVNNDAQMTTATSGNYNDDTIVEDTTNVEGDVSKVIAHYVEIVSFRT